MNRVKSFEELGRKADEATRDAATALNWVQGLGSEEAAAERITVIIRGANWDDGTLRLAEKLTGLVRAQIAPMLQRAVHEMIEDGRKAREALVEQMQNPPSPDLSRQVPRDLDVHTAQDAPPPPPPPPPPAPPTPPERNAWTALDQQSQELMTYLQKNPGTKLAKTRPRDLLAAAGFIASQGSGAHATWDLSEDGRKVIALA